MNEQVMRRASTYIIGIKKRCRKPSRQLVEAYGENDRDAMELLKERFNDEKQKFRIVQGNTLVSCQDITFIDKGEYKIKKMNIFCDSEKQYDICL